MGALTVPVQIGNPAEGQFIDITARWTPAALTRHYLPIP